MPQVRCPRCGALSDTRAPGYPFCSGCQDNLAKCGYCRWLDHNTLICLHPLVAGVFEVTEEATPPCAYHTPGEGILVRRRSHRLLLWPALAGAVFVLVYGAARMLWPASPPRHAGPLPALELAVEADYRGAVVGETYSVMALLYNASDAPANDIRLEIAHESLSALDLREVRPQPLQQAESGNWRLLLYPTLHPRERRRIALELIPREAGTFHFIVRLRSGEGAYHGMADMPITVATQSPAGHAMEQGGTNNETR